MKKGLKKITSTLLIVFFTLMIQSCKVSYSFSGANVGNLQTVSVDYFQNRATLAPPTLSQYVTEAFRTLVEKQTSMTLISDFGDAHFEGSIRSYTTRPMAISADDMAQLDRFTISVQVKYTNSIDPDQSFDETFSHYQDYSSSQSLEAVQTELTEVIIDQILEDVFNRAFVNW